MMRSPRSEKYTVGLVGAGVMGRGIAQIMATAGVSVLLFDTRKGAASDASKFAAKMITRAVERKVVYLRGMRVQLPVASWLLIEWRR